MCQGAASVSVASSIRSRALASARQSAVLTARAVVAPHVSAAELERGLTSKQLSDLDREVGGGLQSAGITRVSGTFTAGDPVDVVAGDGRPVARGLVNYDARELPSLIGRSTRDLARELGSSYEREVIHRDDMVLLHR